MNWREQLNKLNPIQAKRYRLLGGWYKLLNEEFDKDYMKKISAFIKQYKAYHSLLCPNIPNIFRAFRTTSYDAVKVVILGQDPYHTKGTADGLAFSTPQEKTPASLRNIFKEIERSYPDMNFTSNSLESWANQGVMLLNTVLTTEVGQSEKHKDIGWQTFTDKVIKLLNNKEQPIVFMLWGRKAQAYKKLITNDNHLVLETSHPSPFSVERGFKGCNHFKETKDFINKQYNPQIDFST